MTELLNKKIKVFQKALKSLEKVLNDTEGLRIDREIIRDSIIQRFEFSSELAWKTAKIFLESEKGSEIMFPKSVYRELQKLSDFSVADTEIALAMIDDRNRASHDYSENFADDLHKRIEEKYFPVLEKVLKIVSGE